MDRKIISTHKSKVVRDKKLGNMSPQANHFISKNSRIIQNNPGEKISVISFEIPNGQKFKKLEMEIMISKKTSQITENARK